MANFSPGWNSSPPSGLKFCRDYMASFSPGLSTIFPLPPFCFVEYSVNAPAQTHVSTRAEILLRLHEVSKPSSPGWTFSARAEIQPGQKPSSCNRHFHFQRISFRTWAEISARLTGKFQKNCHVITPLMYFNPCFFGWLMWHKVASLKFVSLHCI